MTQTSILRFPPGIIRSQRYVHGGCHRGVPGCSATAADAAETSEVGTGAGAAAWYLGEESLWKLYVHDSYSFVLTFENYNMV